MTRAPLRAAILLGILLWLILFVALPLLEIGRRAVVAEIPVAIFGEDEVRAGGRTIRLDGDGVRIDDESYPLDDAALANAGVQLTVDDRVITSAAIARVLVNGEPRTIRPVTTAIDGETWFIDGVELGPEDYQRTVSRYVGAANLRAYLNNPGLRSALTHSLFIALLSMVFAVSLAFVYAYAVTRSRVPFKAAFRTVAVLPLFAPTMLFGLSLVYLFGNQGLITTGFFENVSWIAFDIGLYGPVGIVIAETVFTFPAAFIILRVALTTTDARLYEAAETLGAGRARMLWTVTLPGVRPGLINAALVTFTLAFTDFGAPKIVGGNYSVLAVEVYKQVVGQQNFSMGAVVSLMLLAPAAIALAVERIWLARRAEAADGRAVPYEPKPNRRRDLVLFTACTAIAIGILVLVFLAGYASLMTLWPYDLSLGLKHYRFSDVAGGYNMFRNSLRMAAYSAAIGTALIFTGGFVIHRLRIWPAAQRVAHVLSVLPLALPGLVIGIAYVFFFNRPEFAIPLTDLIIPNPLNRLIGTMAILVVANIVHFYAVSHLTATTALRQLDAQFEEASESLGAPLYRLFFGVTVPLCLPALIEIAGYLFVSSMATVSAVIFLYAPDTVPAAVGVVNMDDAGDTAAAAAMCMLIVLTNLAVRGLLELTEALLPARWRTRNSHA